MTIHTSTDSPAWETTTLAETTLHAGVSTIQITLTEATCTTPERLPAQVRDELTTYYTVSGARYYATSRGALAEGSRSTTFLGLADAQTYADDWRAALTAKGWTSPTPGAGP